MMLTTALWGVLLPAFVLWGGYTLSPLCFPMVPPTLFRDIYVEVQRLLPSFSGVPPALLRPGFQQLFQELHLQHSIQPSPLCRPA